MSLMQKVAEQLRDAVETGTFEKYFPAYTSAVGGYLGSRVKNVLPKNMQTAGATLGTIVGTGMGLHGGEAVGKKLDHKKTKTAAEEEGAAASVLGKSLLGFGAGTALGYAGLKGFDALAGKPVVSSPAARAALPVIGGALGMAYPHLHSMTVEKMRRAHLKKQEERRGQGP